jgi:D-alanyl-D-alanine carboxypeptidase/D-alanyl-D-alanine-endopeptidase (penicillin-binding protein 4)
MKTLLFALILNALLFSQSRDVNLFIKNSANSLPLIHSQWSVCVRDAETGKILIDCNSAKSLAPASGLKLFTTAYSLDALSPGFQFKTNLYYSGEIKTGILNGNIFIRGGGDPTLGSGSVPGSLKLEALMKRWVSKIKSAGIKQINGSVIADDNLLDKIPISGYWYWIDLGNYYAAQTSALTINDNLYYLYFRPNPVVGGIAEFLGTSPELPGIIFINEMKTGAVGSGDNGYVYRSPYDSLVYLRGTIPQGYNRFSIKGSLPDPPLFASKLLTDYLQKNGVIVSGTPEKAVSQVDYKAFAQIDEFLSPPLKDIIHKINKTSDNLYTSQILKMSGLMKYGEGSRDAGIKGIFEFLSGNGIDTTALRLFDGNGLSRSNTITTKMMTALLSSMKSKPYFKDFYNSLSVAGDPEDDGTFKYFGRGTIIQKNARIKSGYIKGVRSHSGYLKTKRGKFVSFSIIANNFNCDVKEINKIHEKLIVLIAESF